MIKKYLETGDGRDNANMDYSLQGLNNHIAANITKDFWLNNIYSEETKKLHEDGWVHVHDLGLLGTYCCGWDLMDLLQNGFTGVKGKVSSAPAKHFRTVLGQICNFFYTLQGEAAGAQAFSNFDTLLAPFIAIDCLTFTDVKQALQEFIFNMNVPTRVGFQTPFTNITMDLQCPEYLKNTPVFIANKQVAIKDTFEGEYAEYGHFQNEMNMINKAFCEIMLEGDAQGRIFSFPIPTYNITKNFDWENPELNSLWEMTGKYGVPYFANFVNSDMNPEDARSMCCRLRLDNRELRKRGGGLFASNPMTGSIGVITINMVKLANYWNKIGNEFLRCPFLDDILDECKIAFFDKRNFLEDYAEKGLFPYSRYYLRNIKKGKGKYWNNHFNTIGICGMNEACKIMFKKDISDPECVKFAQNILNYIQKKLQEFQEDTGYLFNLEATPAEGASYRLAKLDNFGYDTYTNSTNLPVDYTNDIFEALEHQEQLQPLYTGGTVFHGFLGEAITGDQAKTLLRNLTENSSLPYFSITPTFSVCQNHGNLKGEQKECPICKEKTEIWSRVVGFYRPVDSWNDGKQKEFKNRKTFNV